MVSRTAAGGGPARPWVLPGEPTVVRLMNTIWADRAGIRDDLSAPADLTAWLASAGLAHGVGRVTGDDLDRARQLRDACRRVAARITADPRPAAASAIADLHAAIAEINSVAACSPPIARLALRDGDLQRDTTPLGHALPTALATVAADAVGLFTDHARPPLRACLAPGCVLYFVKDHPRREWCSAACGNRARAARHYRRHRPGADPQPDPH